MFLNIIKKQKKSRASLKTCFTSQQTSAYKTKTATLNLFYPLKKNFQKEKLNSGKTNFNEINMQQ